MIGLFRFVLAVLASPFKSKLRLEAENAVLRLQLIILRRRLHGRVRLTNHDRWFFIQLYRWFPSILKVLTIIRPEAFPWNEAPRYMIRDRDRIYGAVVTRGLRATGIRTSYRTILALAEWVCRAADRIEFAASAWTTLLSWARCICAKSCDPMRTITTASELIDPWTRMRRSSARFSELV